MAKKITPLSFTDIVLGADVATIRKALEARTEIDQLLAQREAAYRQIAEVEGKIDALVGAESAYPFPEPPLPVFGYAAALPAKPQSKKASSATDSAESAPQAE